ncbi:MAG: protein translocase subunit secF, partial [Nevskia sp.]|nr:protein translocase subunit secF [Nevskia sp.]
MRLFSRVPTIDFMAQRKRALVLSAILTAAALTCLFTRGLNFGIDFKGGVLVEVVYPQAVELDQMRAALKDGGYPDAIVQYFGGTSDVMIRLLPEANASSAAISTKVLQALDAKNNKVELRRVEFVGPQVGGELREDGVIAVIAALALIFAFVWFRFEAKFSAGSTAALIHDAIMTVGYLSLVQEEFDLTVLAGLLAMLGYSNNETIVIFDRIREHLARNEKSGLKEPFETTIG